MTVSIISHFLGPEQEGLPKLASIGYRLVEVDRGMVARVEGAVFKELLDKADMQAVCLMGADPGIADEDRALRSERIEKLKGSVLWATKVGAKIVETVPMWSGRSEERQATFERAVGSLKEAGKFAADHGVVLAIEPVNKAETRLVLTLAQAVAMAKAIGLPSVRVMGDTHHMNMMEVDLGQAVRNGGEWLVHFHFSDNDRLPPGLGHMDLKTVVCALAEVGYTGALSLAEISRVGDAAACARHSLEYTRALISACELREQVGR